MNTTPHDRLLLPSREIDRSNSKFAIAWEQSPPHLAQLGAEQIEVRDRDVSNAQESAIQVERFLCEAHARTQHRDFPMLVTTATDGDNGGWFRTTTPGSDF